MRSVIAITLRVSVALGIKVGYKNLDRCALQIST